MRYYPTARAYRWANFPRNPVPGLVPGTHVVVAAARAPQDVDGRDKPGHGELAVNRGAYHILLPGIAGEREIGAGEG